MKVLFCFPAPKKALELGHEMSVTTVQVLLYSYCDTMHQQVNGLIIKSPQCLGPDSGYATAPCMFEWFCLMS